MLLRRFMQHFTSQNWFAVILDVLVVIVGIFLGLQASDWSQERQDKQLERAYLNRLLTDLGEDIKQTADAIRLQKERQAMTSLLIDSLADPTIVEQNASAFIAALQYAGYTYYPKINDDTYEELKSSGRLPLIRDETLRANISGYYNFVHGIAQWDYLRELFQTEYLKRSAGILTIEQQRQLVKGFSENVAFTPEEAASAYLRFMSRTELIDWLPYIETGFHKLILFKELKTHACRVKQEIASELGTLSTYSGCQEATSMINYPASNRTQDSYDPGPGWMQAWADEFNGESLNPSNWNRQVEPAGRFNEEWQRYTDSPDNAYLSNGLLVIKAMHVSETHGMDQYTSARLNTAGKQQWQHGKVVARIQLPYGNGMWPAFWMLGANIDENGGDTPWPDSGEIDIMEFYGSKDNSTIEANIHFAGADGKHASMGAKKFTLDSGWFAEQFHVFEMEWDKDQIIWSVDGQSYARHDLSGSEYAEFHQPFFIVFNLAVGGKYSGRPDDSTEFPQYLYVDWVRVYQKSADSP